MTSRFILIVFFSPLFCISQTLNGRVINKLTQEPIETVAIYFDNTTIGTTTKDNGEFSITYPDVVQSVLVISYLGYKVELISDYRTRDYITIELTEANVELDEVYIEYDDGLTRKQKLRLFRKEFLGRSKYAKSCKILNEDDLILKYDSSSKTLYVSAKAPVKIENKALRYEVDFNIIDFEIKFGSAKPKTNTFIVNSVTYFGTSFYKNLDGFNSKKVRKNRNTAYEGSVQHFMRALHNKDLQKKGYQIFYDKFRIDELAYISVEDMPDSDFKKVKLKTKLSILFNQKFQSKIELKVPEFLVDAYGNYLPVVGVYFSGDMGDQRVGDLLPSDYGLEP